MARVVVIGGGVIGCAVAERLTLERHQVTLLERDHLGCRASGAAAGELSPQSGGSVATASATRSLEMFPELVARIEKDSGINVEFHRQQGLLPAFSADEAYELKTEEGVWLDAQACRIAEPALTTEALGALLLEHAHLTPPRFVRALARAAASRGAEIHEGMPAIGFAMRGDEVAQVLTPDRAFDTEWVVIAAGPWSREVGLSAGVEIAVRPQRGQLAALNPGAVSLHRSIFWSTGYLVPKADGTIVAGSTQEDSGFDDRPTVAGIETMLTFARRLVPGLAGAALEATWAGLRPVTPDGEPLVGPAPNVRNVIIATGHHRKGILLAPIAADTVVKAIS
jgi:glycine oxidase